MNKYIRKFRKHNKFACKKHSGEKNFLILDRGRPAQIFYSSLFGVSINKKKIIMFSSFLTRRLKINIIKIFINPLE